MEAIIERAKPEDAEELLELSRIVGSETANLSFGAEGIRMSVGQERELIASYEGSASSVLLVARLGGKIIGNARYSAFTRPRLAHRGEIGICLRKSAWGKGIGSRLMEQLLDFARNTAGSEIVSLEVRSDNERAIRLYEKYGFAKVGCFRGYFKVNGKLVDFDIMEKRFFNETAGLK